jgi:hypothetical protein
MKTQIAISVLIAALIQIGHSQTPTDHKNDHKILIQPSGIWAAGKGVVLIDGSGNLEIKGDGTVTITFASTDYDQYIKVDGFQVTKAGPRYTLKGLGTFIYKPGPATAVVVGGGVGAQGSGGLVGPPVRTGPSFTVNAVGTFDHINANGQLDVRLDGAGTYKYTGENASEPVKWPQKPATILKVQGGKVTATPSKKG